MKSLIMRIVILLIGVSLLCPVQVVKANQENTNVLLIYDSYAISTSKQGNVDSLKRLLAGLGINVTVINSENYQQGNVESYTYVIILRNDTTTSHAMDTLMNDMESYEGHYLHIGSDPSTHMQKSLQLSLRSKHSSTMNLTIDVFSDSILLSKEDAIIESFSQETDTYGVLESNLDGIRTPFGLKNDRYAFLSFYNKSDLSEWAAGYLIKDWLNLETQGKLYVLLKDVYPFSDLTKLRELSDTLFEAGIPFIVSSKPLFNNYDYPAAKRYAETLKYIQSRNGTILVDAPAVAYTISADLTVLEGNIASYIDFLASHEVAPLGATAEMYWFEDHYYINEGLRFYDSIIILPNVKVMSNQPINTVNSAQSSLYSISLKEWKSYAKQDQLLNTVPFNIAITLNFEEDMDEIDDQLQWLSDTWYQFYDYKISSHRVSTEQNEITSNQGIIKINDSVVAIQQNYTDVSSDYTYIEEHEASFQKLFTFQNKLFIVIISVILIIFAVLLYIGYRMYRKKYLK